MNNAIKTASGSMSSSNGRDWWSGSPLKIMKHFDDNARTVLFNGDCLRLLSEMPDKSIQLIVTSPPYNIGKSYESIQRIDDYLEQQSRVIAECYRVLKDEGHICWQVGNYVENGEIIPLDILLYPIFQKLKLKMRNRIIWHFEHGLHCSKRFSGRYESINWFTKTDNYYFNLDLVRVPQKYPFKKYFKGPKKGLPSCNPLGKNPGDVWEIPNVKFNHPEKTIHPCQFPVELVERLVLSMTKENDWIFDPYAGVGSSLVAALLRNRKAAGADIAGEYVKIAEERIHDIQRGRVRIRPMSRPIYSPGSKETEQFLLERKRRKYGKESKR